MARGISRSALGPALDGPPATGYRDYRTSFLSPTKLSDRSLTFLLAPRRMQVLLEFWTPPVWHKAIMRWAQNGTAFQLIVA